jgi:hypothetical protein
VAEREVTVESERQEEPKVEQLHEAELVRDRLEALDELRRSFPEGHNMRVIIENLHLDRALRAVEEEIRILRDALLHPGGT